MKMLFKQNDPQANAQKNTALGFAKTQSQYTKPSKVLQSVFNCHIFCGYATTALGTLPVPFHFTAKEPSQPTA